MPALPHPWPDLINQATEQTLVLERFYLRLQRHNGELRIEQGSVAEAVGASQPDEADAPRLGPARQSRILLGDDRRPLHIEPRLADRPVVTRPLQPTELLPRQRTTLYLGTPLSLALMLGDQTLAEFPALRLSDTWLGPSTINGELCYATQTRARLELEAVSEDPFKAVTAVTIVNLSSHRLKLDRINIPVPNLPLYSDGQRFATASLTMTRNRDPSSAQVEIDARPPHYTSAAELIVEARRDIRGGVLNRAVDLLFG